MLLKIISYMPAIIGLLIIGLFVLLNNSKSLKNRIFALMNLIIAAWLFFLFLADTTTHVLFALWTLRIALFFGALVFLLFYYFSLAFPFTTRINKYRLMLYSAPLILIALLSFSSLTVSSVKIEDFGVQPQNIGVLYTASDFVGILYVLLGMMILVIKYKKSNFIEKNQIKFVLFGLCVALLINIFTGIVLTLLKIDTKFILFGSFSVFIFSLFVAYAIVKHGLFNIRSVVIRAVAYLLTLTTISIVFIAPTVLLISHLLDTPLPKKAWGVLTLATLLVATLYQPLRSYFNRATNRLFFRDYYEPQEVLDNLTNLLVRSVNVKEIEEGSTRAISDALKPSFVDYLLLQTEDSDHTRRELLKDLLKQQHSTVSQVELEESHDSELHKKLKDNNVAVAIRLQVRREVLGYITLGFKQSGRVYTEQDKKLLGIAADEIAIGLQNALRFEEIQRFNITLQEKVDAATKELKKVNHRLRVLDKSKDEFISMASHQLRTPLTSVKGYLSMVLEGDVGPITKDEKAYIKRAFDGAQKMVYLIADLLNVSRLQTGKFVIENKPTNLAQAVGEELEQLTEQAAAKKITISYHKPSDFPVLNLDETKVRQVVMNFLDNALYYTPNGGKITVEVQSTEDSVSYSVTDTGIGVPKAIQHHLFSKFYRADNAKKMRPDGTGLGLFMAKKVVVAEGGAIIFSSTEGKGSTFGFSFPRAKVEIKGQPTEKTKDTAKPEVETKPVEASLK